MKRILITGVTGFVGTNLVRYLHTNENIKILGYSRNIQVAKTKFTSYHLDFIEDISSEILDNYNVDTIIHLAGIAHDLSGTHNKEHYHEVNHRNTTELYNEFLKSATNAFIFISSVKAVVDHTREIIDENTISRPSSDYGISKKRAEDYILNHSQDNKRTFILRPCMIHGPGNKGNLNLLYRFVKSGLPYPLGSFENKRSFLSIENFCFVIQRTIEEKLNPGVYLLADDQPVSTNDLVRIIGGTIHKSVRIVRFPKKLILFLAKLGSMMHLPFNMGMLSKLCEDMVISNKKLLLNLGEDLPVSSAEGFKKTIESFNE